MEKEGWKRMFYSRILRYMKAESGWLKTKAQEEDWRVPNPEKEEQKFPFKLNKANKNYYSRKT